MMVHAVLEAAGRFLPCGALLLVLAQAWRAGRRRPGHRRPQLLRTRRPRRSLIVACLIALLLLPNVPTATAPLVGVALLIAAALAATGALDFAGWLLRVADDVAWVPAARWGGLGRTVGRALGWLSPVRRYGPTVALALLVASGVGGGAARLGHPREAAATCAGWNLATDFKTGAAHANPNPDGCGNADTWSFLKGASLTHDPATYSALANYTSGYFGIAGLEGWDNGGSNPNVNVNASGAFQQASTIAWPAGAVLMHPLPGQLVVVGWRSPIAGTVTIAGAFRDLDPNSYSSSNGIDWSIDRGATALAQGAYANGGSQTFGLAATVAQGETLYFTVGPQNGNYYNDSTQLDLQITPGADPVTEQHDGSPCAGYSAFVADPVNVVFGSFVEQQRDFGVPGPGLAVDLTRTYHSANKQDGGFGVGWAYPYGMNIAQETPTTVLVRMADCRLDRYSGSGVGAYTPPTDVFNGLVKNADGTWTLTTPGKTVISFDATGRLAGLRDRVNNAVTLAYTATTVTVKNPAGRGFALTYGTGADAAHFVSMAEVGGVGRTAGYAYSAAGDLTGVTDVRGGLTQMTYDAGHRLLTVIDPRGVTVTTNVYDAAGRVSEQRDAQNKKTTLTYDGAARQTVVRDDAGVVTGTYGWDTGNRVPTLLDGANNATARAFDANNRLTCLTDPTGRKTGYAYDASGNVTAIIDPANTDANCALKVGGVRTTIAYNLANQPLVVTDPLGHATTYAYDAGGYLTTVTNALNQATIYTYVTVTLTAGGTTKLVATVKDPLNRVTTYTYNGLGQVATVKNALNQVTTLAYDAAGRLVTSTRPGSVAECREYDSANNLTAVVQNCKPGLAATVAQNVRTEYGYDGTGRQVWAKGPTGEINRTVYEARGLVDRTIAGCANGGVYSATTCDPFAAANPQLNRVTTFAYDDRGRVATSTDPLGVVTRTEYDSAGRPFKATGNYLSGGPTDASTNVAMTTEYDAAGRATASVDPLGRRTVYRYDPAGRRYETVRNYVDGDPTTGSADSDLVTRAEYDAAGRVVAVIDNYIDGLWDPAKPDEDNRTVTVYDDLNRPIRMIAHYVDGVSGVGEPDTDLIGETTYDAAGNVIASVDPLGRVAVTAYDALNRPTSATRNCTDGGGVPRTSGCAAGHGPGNDQNLVTTTAYTVRGAVDFTIDQAGRKTDYTYDLLDRVTQVKANAGGTVAPADVATTYTYDAAGRVLTVKNPTNNTTTNAYNGAGWLTSVKDPTNRTTTYTYDGLGRQVGAIDPLAHERRTLYDPLGRVTAGVVNWQDGVVTGADGQDRDLIAASEYDAAGRRVATTDAGGRRTAYAYDGLDRLGGVTENQGGALAPANVATGYAYDRRGLLTSLTDANTHTRQRGYDAAGRQTRATDGLGRVTTMAYDRGGRLVSGGDPRPVTVNYNYDLTDRVTTIDAAGLATIGLSYDLAGRRATLADASGTTTYGYDGLDRATSVAHSLDGAVAYGYDASGRRTSLAVSGALPGFPSLSYTYDGAGRLTAVKQGTVNVATATYDPAGRLATVTRYNGGTAGAKTTYTYDNADRTTGQQTKQGTTTLGNFTYAYARNGQATQATEVVQGSTTRTVGYQYDGLGRLALATAVAGATTTTYGYTYDNAGNRTSASVNGTATQTRAYDAADQVTSAGYSYDGAGNLLADGSQTYTYDPLGRLASATTGGATTGYAYNGDGTLAAKTVGGATTRYTLDTQGGLSERLGQTASGAAMWYIRGWGAELARGTSGGTTWYLADRLGSVRGEYGTTASVAGKTNYDPFGVPEVGAGLGAPADYGFTGEPQDAATGLVQLRARWYQPGGGQFVSRDPFAGEAGSPQTLNPYAYAHNDPTTLTDPTGMSPLREPGGGGTSGASSAAPVVASQASEEGFLCVDATGTILFIFPSVREFLLYAYKLGKIVVPAAGVAGPVGVTVAGACILAPQACLLVGVAVGAVAVAAGVVVIAKLIEPKHLPAQDPAGRPVAQPGPAPCPLDANGQPTCETGTTVWDKDKLPVYHCRRSTSQTDEDVVKQVVSGEIWGSVAAGGLKPSVQAFIGELPPGIRGIEFQTPVPFDDRGMPRAQVYWTGPRPGVEVAYDPIQGREFAKIKAFIRKVV